MVDTILTNLRYALRRLARSPLFTVVAVVSLGLGIGANTAMFSLVNAVIIRDQPFADPESLLDVFEATDDFSHGTLSYPDYEDFRERSTGVFEDVAGMQLVLLQLDGDVGAEMLAGEAVTGNYFPLLGIQAAYGRMLTMEDHVAPGAHPVVVLGHTYWETRFGADPGVVGQELRMEGRPYTIVGVAPESFSGSLRGIMAAAYVPMMMIDVIQGTTTSQLEARGNQSFFGKARLLPGATFAQAQAVGERVTLELRQEHPQQWEADKRFVMVPTADVIMNPMVDRVLIPAAGLIMVVVGLVLLIACANLASFLLARAADRRKEIAVRLAMGARRRALIGQLLTETVVLSVLGGLVGVGLAVQSLAWLSAADLPLPLPITLDLTLDRTVLGFSMLVSLAAGLLFGLAPALQSTNPDLAPTLRDETAGGGRARSGSLRNALVVAQVAVSVVLLIGAGLMLRSLDASRRIDPGFGAEPTGLVEIVTPVARYSEEEARIYLASVTEAIGRIPGVQAVGYTGNLHLNSLSTSTARINVDGVEPPAGRDFHSIDHTEVSDGFFDAAGIELLEGRVFSASEDVVGGDPVVIVNEAFATRFFPAGDAVGRTIDVRDAAARVIGVVATAKIRQIGEAPRPFVYGTLDQEYVSYDMFLARTTGDADALALQMVAAARALDPDILVVGTKTMARHLGAMFIARQLGALVVSGFAVLALLLASIGLYGVVSYAVSRRAREVGIRMSLGAEPETVVWMLTASGMRLVGVGTVLGLLIAAAGSGLLSRLLYGIPALDPITFFGVPLALGTVAFFASWLPARRVTRIDPVRALRSE